MSNCSTTAPAVTGKDLINHAAKLRIVRAGRQFRQLMEQVWPEASAAIDIIGSQRDDDVALDLRFAFGAIHFDVEHLEQMSERLLNDQESSEEIVIDPLAEATGVVDEINTDLAAAVKSPNKDDVNRFVWWLKHTSAGHKWADKNAAQLLAEHHDGIPF